MFSAERLERSVSNPFPGVARAVAVDAALFVALAASIAVFTSVYGAYDIDVWAPVGLVLVPAAGALLAAGRRPPGAILLAAAAIVALGAWSVVSTAWGGLPQQAWLKLDQSLLAAAALLVGSCLTAKPGRRGLVLSAVLVGVSVHAVVVLARLAIPSHPEEWLQGRFLQGPVGYHNAQGLLFALAVPIALWAADHPRTAARIAGGAAAAVLTAGVLLTQSRGALLGVGLAVVVQLAWSRRASAVLPAAALVAVTAGLFLVLREVDEALFSAGRDEQVETLRTYLLATAAGAVIVGAVAALAHARFVRRTAAVALVVLLGGAGIAVAAHERTALWTATFTLPGLAADTTSIQPAGTTRITTLAPGGRLEAWRVAKSMAAENPVVGAGQGQFARRWAEDRDLPNLYIRRPHSLELELAAELGAVGLAVFAFFVVALSVGLTQTSRRSVAAAAMGTGTVLLVDASVDWTWSFPGIVVPSLLAIGAAVGSRAVSFPGRAVTAAIVLATFALSLGLVLPYLADSHVDRARALMATDGRDAWSELEAARELDPWNADALSLEGLIAEEAGDYDLAVRRFEAAAANTDRPWDEHFRAAHALARSGDTAAARRACERAVSANPGEARLYEGPCGYTVAGNRWPVMAAAVSPPTAATSFSGFYVDKECTACALRFSGSELVAATAGQADSRDTAYGVIEIAGRGGSSSLAVRDVLRLPAEERIETHVVVLQVRDVRQRLVLELFVRSGDGTISIYSPPGGLRSDQLNRSTRVMLQPGGPAHLVEIEVLRDVLNVRVDGTNRLQLRGLRGATTGAPALVRAGIIARLGWNPHTPLSVAHREISVSRRP